MATLPDLRGCAVLRNLPKDDNAVIVDTYYAWRSEADQKSDFLEKSDFLPYADVPGFCKSAVLEEIRGHDYYRAA
jgi:type I restriction enzyme M protein